MAARGSSSSPPGAGRGGRAPAPRSARPRTGTGRPGPRRRELDSRRVNRATSLTHEVYGYLPYWQLNGSTAERLDYRLLSTIAFFGIGIKPDGNLDKRGFGYAAFISEDAIAVTNAAHARGVRVVPTFQLFGWYDLTE